MKIYIIVRRRVMKDTRPDPNLTLHSLSHLRTASSCLINSTSSHNFLMEKYRFEVFYEHYTIVLLTLSLRLSQGRKSPTCFCSKARAKSSLTRM